MLEQGREAKIKPHAEQHELAGGDTVRLSVQNGGTQLNRHRTLNFSTGLTATESSANKRIDVTLADHDHTGDAGDGGILASYGRPVFLTSPLTSTSFDGDSFSTMANAAVIDLSTAFSAPAGIKAALVNLQARDSGSAGSATDLYVALGPSATTTYALGVHLQGVVNDAYGADTGIVPCDANGDVYYKITASGPGAMDVWIRILGYWL